MQDKKVEHIVGIYVGEILGIADYFLIGTVNSSTQADAVIDELEKTAKELELSVIGISGDSNSKWILIDFGSVVVHLFNNEAREFYRLESLWKDCPSIVF